jgi:CMP-N-acetylneuraminic acid synthetase
MLAGMRVLVVVPARGGSKGIPLKNIYPVCGRPLIAYTADVVKALPWVDMAICSTDHPEIMKIAHQEGLRVPFRRPDDLGGDFISDLQVLTHVLHSVDEGAYDVVVMLQPTCPLRKPRHVTWAVHRLIAGGYDSVWTVSRTPMKYHPLKQLWVTTTGQLGYWDRIEGPRIIARQQLDEYGVHYRNGAAYAFTRECLLDQKTIMGKNAGAVLIQDDPLVNIDTLEDIAEVERIMRGKP